MYYIHCLALCSLQSSSLFCVSLGLFYLLSYQVLCILYFFNVFVFKSSFMLNFSLFSARHFLVPPPFLVLRRPTRDKVIHAGRNHKDLSWVLSSVSRGAELPLEVTHPWLRSCSGQLTYLRLPPLCIEGGEKICLLPLPFHL